MNASFTAPLDILIITALGEEVTAINSCLDNAEIVYSQNSALTYTFSTISAGTSSYAVATTCIFEMGNASAAALATSAIHELSPTYVIMFGLAGGIKGQIELGDVIVPTQIYYYELAKVRPGGDIETRPIMFETDAMLLKRMESYGLSYRHYGVKFGPFAVGEKVVSDVAVIEDFKKYIPKLLGIEMESFGIAKAAHHSPRRPQFIAVRGVSDFADAHKDDNSRQQCLENAADFLLGFLRLGALPKAQRQETSAKASKTMIAIHHLSLERRTSIKNALDTTLIEYGNHHIEELLIDQTDLFQHGRLISPTEGFDRQKTLISRLDLLLQTYPGAEIGYFGLAHIPYIFHAGYEVNRREIRTFGTNRQTSEWQALPRSAGSWSKIAIVGLPSTRSDLRGEVVLRMSVSSEVLLEQVQEVISSPIASVHLAVDDPHLDYITCEEQLNEYASRFRQVLTDIQRLVPNARTVHLFFAGPPVLAFRCGQQISKTSDPDVIVFNFSKRDSPNYRWALNICTGEIHDYSLPT